VTKRPWSTLEIKVLRHYATAGAETIAAILDRSVISVKHKAHEYNISLENTGEDIDITDQPAKILQRIREAPDLNICPMCGTRLATMRDTAMCRPCHLEQLIQLRETELETLARKRRLTKIRQDKRRQRICDHCGRAYYPRTSTKSNQCADCGGKE
jgi:NADH pyrophosphatase NudC (nudix superfamily)